jgi:hypothetical protein
VSCLPNTLRTFDARSQSGFPAYTAKLMTHLEQPINPSNHAAQQGISLLENGTDVHDPSPSSPAKENLIVC